MRPLVRCPAATAVLLRHLGGAHVCLNKAAGTPVKSHGLAGRLYLSGSGWLLMSVPNALGRGAFDALDEAGVELPVSETTGQYNAHVSVATPEEVAGMGGPAAVSERGHSYAYTLGAVKEVEPSGWGDMSKCWFIEVESPDLKELRRSYGLTALPHGGEHPFHITFAVRRKRVLGPGDAVSKAAARVEKPVRDDAGDPADCENCPSCGTPMERGEDGYCNTCGGPWPAKTAAENLLGVFKEAGLFQSIGKAVGQAVKPVAAAAKATPALASRAASAAGSVVWDKRPIPAIAERLGLPGGAQ